MRLLVTKLFYVFAFALTAQSSFSQERQLGTWKVFMPYNVSVGICDAGDKVYSAAHYTVFSHDKSTGVLQTYDKASGLSDVGIQTINYDPASKYLAIAYINNNLDFIYNGTDVYNISDMKNASSSGSISIYSISFYQGNAYVSSDLGISVINLTKKEIDDTYKIGFNGAPQKVYASCIDGTNIYAATDNGIKYASLTSTNLEDFNAWHLFNEGQNIPSIKASNLAVFNGNAYAVIAGPGNASDTLFKFDTGSNMWQKIYFSADNNDSIVTLSANPNGNLYFSVWDQSAESGGKNIKYSTANVLTVYSPVGHQRPLGWFESGDTSWEADYYNGLFKNNSPGNPNALQGGLGPDGPFSANTFALEAKNNVLTVAGGGVDDSWYYSFNNSGFYIYKNDSWINENQYSAPAIANCLDEIAVATVESTNKTYVGSFFAGLIERNNNNGNITVYDKDNTSGWLEGDMGDSPRTKISCFAIDQNDNLWMGDCGATKPIKMLAPDGTRKAFQVPYSISVPKKMVIDDYGQFWIPIRSQTDGILVWSYNGTLDDLTDDHSKLLLSGTGHGGLPAVNVNCVAKDKDGNIWAGTDQGIGVFYCPGSVLSSYGCDAEQIKVTRNGYVGYLFGMQSVRSIAVDAANRKWVGTTQGLWLISADGQTELHSFTVDNSPLPSNIITDIAIDNTTGEVFVGTTGGLVSYQGDAIDTCIGCTEALVYPNPVKPDYTGPIAIKGLVNNAYVKITDVSGALVYQGRANGTQMIWNGMGYTGERVKSGVYLVFSSDDTGKQRRVAKILVMN